MFKSPRRFIPFQVPLEPSSLLRKESDALFEFFGDPASMTPYYLGRNGIWHGIDLFDLRPGDEVLMPAYHEGIEVEVLKRKGLCLKYYRIDERFCADLESLAAAVSPRSRVLYVIHYLGWPQPIKRLRELADTHKLILFEDCCLSLLSRLPSGERLGEFGDLAIYCPYKTLPVPHGGLLRVNRPGMPSVPATRTPDRIPTLAYGVQRLADYVILHTQGLGFLLNNVTGKLKRRVKGALRGNELSVFTSRFHEQTVDLGASPVVLSILRRLDLDDVVARRRRNYAHLARSVHKDVRTPLMSLPDGVCPLFFPVLVEDKKAVHARLLEEGVETEQFWSYLNPDVADAAFPEVGFLRRHVLAVPIHQCLGSADMDYVAEKLNRHARWPMEN